MQITNHHLALYQWPIRFKDLVSKNRLECRHPQVWPRPCRLTHTGSNVTHQLDCTGDDTSTDVINTQTHVTFS